MNCQRAQEQIVAAVWDELTAAETAELDGHLAGCESCRAEREQLLGLQQMANAYSVEEPEANLTARVRLRLAESLDNLPPESWGERLARWCSGGTRTLASVPAAAVLLVAVSAGSVGGYQMALYRIARLQPTPGAVAAVANSGGAVEIANISSVSRQPDSQNVEVVYNQLVPGTISGSAADPSIRRLLVAASQSATSPAVREDAVALLADECRAGHSCQPAGIRDTLLVALRYGKSRLMRERALHGLEPYVVEDMRVRDAVLDALMNDGEPSIRTAAIHVLTPVEADTSVRQVLHSVAHTDRNPFIRNASQEVLDQVSEIQ